MEKAYVFLVLYDINKLNNFEKSDESIIATGDAFYKSNEYKDYCDSKISLREAAEKYLRTNGWIEDIDPFELIKMGKDTYDCVANMYDKLGRDKIAFSKEDASKLFEKKLKDHETFEFDSYGTHYSKVRFIYSKYANKEFFSSGLYLGLECWEDNYWETYGDISTNLTPDCYNFVPDADAIFIRNDKEWYPEIKRIFKETNVAVPTGRKAYSGFCTYDEWVVNRKVLKEIGINLLDMSFYQENMPHDIWEDIYENCRN